MNPEVKRIWLEALRGGEYGQARRRLRASANMYCCLGLLCELHRQTAAGGRWIDGRYLGSDRTLPPEVVDWAELKDDNPDIPHLQGQGKATLAEFNDGRLDSNIRPHTFAEIADLIEQYL